jgi:hypothetical protein
MNTQDLSDFGNRELLMASELLQLLANGKFAKENQDSFGSGVKLEFNPNSGHVFLYDEDMVTVMKNGGELEQWIYCSDCGNEGFISEIGGKNGYCKDCANKPENQ